MKKLLVLVFVAALCLPCYARPPITILVYKFTCNLKPWIEADDGGWAVAAVGTQQVSGYCVLEVWESYGGGEIEGILTDPTIICYGKNGRDKWGTSFDISLVEDEITYVDFDIKGKPGKSGIIVFVDEDEEHDIVGAFYVPLYGENKLLDIGQVADPPDDPGTVRKVHIPGTLKGTVEAWASVVDDFEAFGSITVTYPKYTKAANKSDPDPPASETVDQIIEDLTKKGYDFP
ncbi:MAG: hypothetical protein JW947_08590 [Sedimentisphaerales bacterium]|nr:hypothetical protein [Sedimentisphaerales bacterium]